jgi:hypothetical protein
MFTAVVALLASCPTHLGLVPDARPLTKQVAAYLASKQWPEVFRTVKAWSKLPKDDQTRLAELLTKSLIDRSPVQLRDTQDLIIPYRLARGELNDRGHGLVVCQDLFTVGGRAAWALSRLLETDLPYLNDGLTAEEWVKRVADITRRVAPSKVDAKTSRKPE